MDAGAASAVETLGQVAAEPAEAPKTLAAERLADAAGDEARPELTSAPGCEAEEKPVDAASARSADAADIQPAGATSDDADAAKGSMNAPASDAAAVAIPAPVTTATEVTPVLAATTAPAAVTASVTAPAADTVPAAGTAPVTAPAADSASPPAQEAAPATAAEAEAEAIAPERIRHAKRTRALLISILLILLLAFGGLIYLGYSMVTAEKQGSSSLAVNTPARLDEEVIDDNLSDGSLQQITTIPNLRQLFGLGIEQVSQRLSSDFVLTKSEDTEDATNPDIRTLVTYSYAPSSGSSTSAGTAAPASGSAAPNAASRVENLYLSLNTEGKVIEVYYVASLDLLGYDDVDFAALIDSSQSVTDVLRQAGIAPASDWKFTAPKPDAYTQYVDPAATVKKVKKLTATFYAATNSTEAAPRNWNLTFTYDYGASGVVLDESTMPTQRMLYLKLY
jgi:hypothetical protein